MLLWLAACTPPEPPPVTDPPVETPAPPPAWDPAPAAIDCAPGGDAPLLEAALADAGLAREDFGYTERQWTQWGDYVENPFVLSWYTAVHHAPEQVPCFAGQLTTDLDAAAAALHPVAGLLLGIGTRVDATFVADPADPGLLGLEDALAALLEVTGDTSDTSDVSGLDPDLAAALVPIVLAVTDAVATRYALDGALDEYGWGATKVYNQGPGMVLDVGRTFPDYSDPDELAAFEDWYGSDLGPRALLDPARRIAFAIEDADLGRFVGLDASLRIETAAGAVLLSPGTADTHGDDEGALLLHVELGGDDVYTGAAGANTSGDHPVAVLVDLDGDDTYGYEPLPHEYDTDGVLVSDAEGRSNGGGYFPSASTTGRQGSGRYGIGFLYDLGAGADTYASLRMSQGFGAMGVGVLADDGGDDSYAAEAGAQGAGVFGVGLLYDGGGTDTYEAWAFSQGFGYVGSGGLAYDRDGDDTWWSDPGNDYGGTTIYYSPQLAQGQGNSSFTQGAGFGLRGDAYSVWLAGGLGVLRDAAGNDAYTAGVFAQATGYWEGTGVLADGGGDDRYDALWYIQGGAAHFALAIFVDAAGNDRYNPTFTPYNVLLGSGHDFSVGVAIDGGGDDWYHYTTLAAGASNCQGIGVFVDNDGSDTYQADSAYSTGLGNHSTECATRLTTDSEGFFLDGGGDPDTYLWPAADTRTPADDSSFGIAWSGTSDEYGGAVDGDGGTGFLTY
ncbi:MAG: hypothetical protein Q8P41_09375 [Pseudomonadota bacterium]|nr:hypothetical protein [Pseudomonadota bacterium]